MLFCFAFSGGECGLFHRSRINGGKTGAGLLAFRHSAVKYHLNLDSLMKRNRKAISALTACKKYAILKKNRAALHHAAGRSAIDQKKIVREQRRWIVTVWRARPTLHSTSRKRVSALGVICCVRSGLFLLPFSA